LTRNRPATILPSVAESQAIAAIDPTRGDAMIRAAAATLAFLVFAVSANADTMKLASHYAAAGTNPDGSAYTGSVQVQIISDTTFAIQWKIAGAIYKGFGMRRNNALAATYTLNGEPGLVIYEVDDAGAMHGLWAVRGQSGSGTEQLTPAD
jgi:hypothetical protein